MATLAMFRARFPEFNGVSDGLVATYLQDATLELDVCVWGPYGQPGGAATKIDLAQLWLTAHNLAFSPFGQNARVVIPKKTGYEASVYGLRFVQLRDGVVVTAGVA